jgi:uncharacterized protein (DUF362 family)
MIRNDVKGTRIAGHARVRQLSLERYVAMPDVVITHSDRIEAAIEQALAAIDLEPLVHAKRVTVKPNETWASESDKTGVTQPDTLRAVLQAIKRHEPAELIVSGGAGAAETDDVFRVVGLMDVVEQEGAEFFDHNRPPFTEEELHYGPNREVVGPQKSVMVNPRVLEYDTLISLAQLKLHATATVTLSLKNIAMSYPAADYYGHPRKKEVHPNHFFDDMHSFIAAMVRRFPIHLAIIVGHPAMIGTGPLGGHAIETGIVIASTDAVAADVVGAQLLGFSAQAVRHLWEAGHVGLGETNLDKITFPALSMKDAIKRFTKAAYGRELTFEHA